MDGRSDKDSVSVSEDCIKQPPPTDVRLGEGEGSRSISSILYVPKGWLPIELSRIHRGSVDSPLRRLANDTTSHLPTLVLREILFIECWRRKYCRNHTCRESSAMRAEQVARLKEAGRWRPARYLRAARLLCTKVLSANSRQTLDVAQPGRVKSPLSVDCTLAVECLRKWSRTQNV